MLRSLARLRLTFTIPQALKAIYDHGAGTVVVINVLDPAKHGSNISNESITFDANNRAKLAHRNVRNVVLKPSSSNSSTFNTAAFSVDEQTGIITRKGADIPPGAKVCAYYSRVRPYKGHRSRYYRYRKYRRRPHGDETPSGHL